MINFLLCFFPVFGNIHGHTSFSDGCGTPHDAYNFAKSKNLYLYGLTDHSHHLDANEWEITLACADSFTDKNFIAICGQEVGKLNYFGHINVYGEYLDEVVPEKCWYNLDSLYDYISRNNLIGIFNHPEKNHFENFKYNEKYRDYMCGIEVINRDSVYENSCIKALSKGWKLGFIASQDNHGWNWGVERNKRGRILQTAFLIDSFSKDEIFKALKKRRTYAFELFPDEDTVFVDFWVGGKNMGENLSTSSTLIDVYLEAKAKVPFLKILIFIDSLPDTIFVYQNKVSIQKKYFLKDGSHFIFAKLIQADFDRVWISPVFVDIKSINIIYPSTFEREGVFLKGIFSLDGRKIKDFNKGKGILFCTEEEKTYKLIVIK